MRKAAPGKTVAYLCYADRCSAPVESPAELAAQLSAGNTVTDTAE